MKTLQEFIAEMPKERQEYIKQKTDEMALEVGLALLREEVNLSQQKLADALGVSQPAIAQIEQRGADVRLITLKRYIEGIGGKLKLAVELPSGVEKIIRL